MIIQLDNSSISSLNVTIPITVPTDVLFWCILPSRIWKRCSDAFRKITPVSVNWGNINTLRKSLQTTSASPYRTQVQLAASFLVCFLIFIEYKSTKSLGKIFKIRKTHKIRCSKTLILCVLSWKYLLFSEYSSKISLNHVSFICNLKIVF